MKRGDREQLSDQAFFFVGGLIAMAALWFRYKSVILRFYFENRLVIAFMVSLVILAGYLKAKATLLRLMEPQDLEEEVLGENPGEDSVFAGISEKGKRVHIKQSFRRMHTQVIGTTNAGKTESVILPWAIDDIKKGRGLLIVDGKSDRSLLDKLYAYAKRYRREDDVRILSLCEPSMSHTFNPLSGGSALEVTERIFKAYSFESEYYKSLQYEAMLQLLLLFEKVGLRPTPIRIVEALQSPVLVKDLAANVTDETTARWVQAFTSLTKEEREQRTSGLVAQLQAFAVGETTSVFNAETSDIDLSHALDQGLIIYCQLPVLKIPTLGKATGKLILQCLQSAVASRHLGVSGSKEFFSVYLDDFTEYLTESFVSLLNKSRSANVAIVFAHQALGDLAVLGDGVMNTILTNANLKVFMRTNEPESAEYFSSVIGTAEGLKVTERQKKGVLGSERTGDGSVRDVEEFKYHPNLFKQRLGVGEAVVVLPHAEGSLPVRLKFRKLPDLEPCQIPLIAKSVPRGVASVAAQNADMSDGIDHLIRSKPKTKEAA